ncbi:GtrA family protein [Herbaspirillum frisingense GSF30]|uniref:GtrA family protein n=1 Tax=Herbaspirillum frisingense GSF30 TaxID=864073 RepID=A0AAI9N1C8_9BURK|nr:MULTISPECIES: GtrA family protein [Herbaspirillum]EOA02183.1 GtrA family protein [Herbaspirillum frisingense GSF30]
MIPRGKYWIKFLIGGLINTGFSYATYLVLKLLLPYQQAYLLAYVAGVVFSYLLNSLLVFRVPLSWRRFLAFPLVYGAQYIASALLLHVLVESLGISSNWAPLLVTAAVLPMTYLLSKLILLHKANAGG